MRGVPGRDERRAAGARLRSWLVLSLAAFLIAGGGSFVLAGRALRPIRRINEALADVSASRLDGRIDAAGFDRELHPLIEQLNAALDRLEKGFRRERQFTADASHELRTPLAAILSSIEVLLRRPREEAELVEAHRDNWRTARSMQSDHRRPAAPGPDGRGQIPAGQRGARPGRARRRSPRLVRGPGRSRAPCGSSRPWTRASGSAADPAQLRLALSNLIDNAVRYNRLGGTRRR